MQNRLDQEFIAGELYVFHATDSDCPAEGGLYGIFDRETSDGICLESSSLDLKRFPTWRRLPEEYQYCRLASRDELRDYMYGLGCSESQAYCLRKNDERPSESAPLLSAVFG